jgi:FkbM family methyltransferase
VNDQIYQWGIRFVGFTQKIRFLATPLTAFCRIWLRHHKIRQFLIWGNFDTVIDGGANVGEFSSLVRANLPHAQLLCVEPHAACAAHLRRQGYNVIEAAIWHEKKRINLSQPGKATTSCTVMLESEQSSLNTWEVDGIRLEDLPITGKNIFIKLDLQGAEIHALKGMDTLWNRCKALMLEVSIKNDGNYESLRYLLSEKGFSEYSTTNELEEYGQIIEADKIWLHRDFR